MKIAPAAPEAEDPDPSSPPPMGVQLLSFLAGVAMAVLGARSALDDYRLIRKLTNLDGYASTPGVFLEVKVRRDTAGSEDDWHPEVLYEYFVDGKSIWGWRLSYEEQPRPRDYWERRLSGYAKGAPVQVHYRPDDPKDSILEKKRESLARPAVMLALGMLFLLAGLVLAILPASSWIRKALVRR